MNKVERSLIGDLLVKAEFVSAAQMADVIPISLTSKLPVGRLLISSGILSEKHFKSAIAAQSLIRENLLPEDLAVKALKKSKAENINFDECLRDLGWRMEYYRITNSLGGLLFESGLLKKEEIDACLEDHFITGMPLGRVIVLNGLLSELEIYSALTAQVLIRERKINRKQAIDALVLAVQRNKTLEESIHIEDSELLHMPNAIRLGELLIIAGLVSEIDLLSAVERGMQTEQPIGQVLISIGLISEGILNQALALQKMVFEGEVKPLLAGLALKKVRKTGLSIKEAVSKVKSEADYDENMIELPELLNTLGLIGKSDIEKAIDYSSTTESTFAEVVYQLKLVDISTLDSAQFCLDLCKAKKLTVEQALFVMQSHLVKRVTAQEIIAGLGWSN